MAKVLALLMVVGLVFGGVVSCEGKKEAPKANPEVKKDDAKKDDVKKDETKKDETKKDTPPATPK